ncbi:MAG TPA: chromate transporter [Acidocella sp.]|jgi:chromate transporter|nr:MAG: chromate transporter [Acidocella sp. 20-58-15]HQT39326.1 chromate transporter [Acidocella sp.]
MTTDVPQKLDNRSLFIGFFQIGIVGFGGVLAIARRAVVEERKWLTATEFSELFSLCQFMPGANITNFAFAFGARHGGLRGAAAAVSGLLAAPLVIVLVMGALFQQYANVPLVQHSVRGMAAAAAGLIAATAIKMAQPSVKQLWSVVVLAAAVGLVVGFHLSLPVTMLVLLPVSVALAWRP